MGFRKILGDPNSPVIMNVKLYEKTSSMTSGEDLGGNNSSVKISGRCPLMCLERIWISNIDGLPFLIAW